MGSIDRIAAAEKTAAEITSGRNRIRANMDFDLTTCDADLLFKAYLGKGSPAAAAPGLFYFMVAAFHIGIERGYKLAEREQGK